MTPPASTPVATRASDATLERLLSLHPKLVDLSLGRVETLLARLGHPETKLPPVVHVTGTNGKGSVLAFLRAMLEAAGRRVHVYTSPHLVRFHERIRLAGEFISEDHLQAVLDECETVNAGAPITFFEITTAAAFLAFSRTPADILLLENGLGGRLDATNVVAKPALTAITRVAMDHQQFLGNSLAEIAVEKAGIIKPGVTCVLGPQHPDAMSVITSHADAKGAPVQEFGVNWRVHAEGEGIVLEHGGEAITLPSPALVGPHQTVNAGQAAVMARCLSGFGLDEAAIGRGLVTVDWPARLQRLTKGPVVDALGPEWEVWLDGGHNPDAGESIARHAAAAWGDRPLHLISGMINTKDPAGYFRPLADIAVDVRTVTIPGEQAAVPAEDLAKVAAKAGLAASVVADAETAARDIAAGGGAPGRVLICGSLYLAGRILADHG